MCIAHDTVQKRFHEAEEKGELSQTAAIEKIHVRMAYTPECVNKYDKLGEDLLEEEMQAKLESCFIDDSSHGIPRRVLTKYPEWAGSTHQYPDWAGSTHPE